MRFWQLTAVSSCIFTLGNPRRHHRLENITNFAEITAVADRLRKLITFDKMKLVIDKLSID